MFKDKYKNQYHFKTNQNLDFSSKEINSFIKMIEKTKKWSNIKLEKLNTIYIVYNLKEDRISTSDILAVRKSIINGEESIVCNSLKIIIDELIKRSEN